MQDCLLKTKVLISTVTASSHVVLNEVQEMRAITDPEEANTIPRVPFPAPSRPPFAGLSGLTGGPFGQGGGSPVFSLKKREKKKFIDTEIGNSSQIPIDRLRQIDLIRLYTPLPEERKELRIPESIVRLNLAEVKHLLLLCGGCVFVRLSHEVSAFFKVPIQDIILLWFIFIN